MQRQCLEDIVSASKLLPADTIGRKVFRHLMETRGRITRSEFILLLIRLIPHEKIVRRYIQLKRYKKPDFSVDSIQLDVLQIKAASLVADFAVWQPKVAKMVGSKHDRVYFAVKQKKAR